MPKQLRKENYIPVVISLVFSVVLFLLFLLPHSQYSILGEMTALNSNVTLEGEPLKLNVMTVLPAIFTLFVILLNSVVFLLSVLALFMDMLFNFHLVNKINLIIASVAASLEVAYLFTGMQGVFDDGTHVIEWPNYITVILSVIALVSLYITYFKFVDKPYKEVMAKAKEKAKIYQAEEKREEKEHTQAESIMANANDDMQKMVLKMLSEGKISPEEADKLLKEIHSH